MSEWTEYRLEDFAEIKPTESIPKGTIAKKIPMEFIQSFTKRIPDYLLEEYKGGVKFRNGDTLMARITPSLENGKTSYVDILEENEIGFGSTEFIVLRENKNVSDKHFLYYLAISPTIRFTAIKSMTGSSRRQRVQTDVVKEHVFDTPELNEQRAIASVLSSLDDKIDLLHRQNQTLKHMAEKLFRQWFVERKGLNHDSNDFPDNLDSKNQGNQANQKNQSSDNVEEADERWEDCAIEDLCTRITSGGTPSTKNESFYEGTINWYSTKELQDNYLIESEKTITKEGLNNSSAKLFPKNTIIIAIYVAPTVGRLGILQNEASFNQAACGLIADEEICCFEFLFIYLKIQRVELNAMASGSAQQNFNVKKIKDFPAFKVDKTTMNSFSSAVRPVFEKIETNYLQIRTLTSLWDTLLPKLMSGEVRVEMGRTTNG